MCDKDESEQNDSPPTSPNNEEREELSHTLPYDYTNPGRVPTPYPVSKSRSVSLSSSSSLSSETEKNLKIHIEAEIEARIR